MMNFKIRILTVNDAGDFKNIRLAALLNAPQMFGSSYTIEVDKPLGFFHDCLSHSVVFGVYVDEEIIALATLSRETLTKLSHKAYLSSVFVQPKFQSKGIANHLLNAVIQYSKEEGIEQILLTVADNNNAAISLYQKFGFQNYGIDRQALKENGQYTDELLMKLLLCS